MDSIIGYVVLFVVGLSVLYAYQWRKIKKRDLKLSRQSYSDALLELLIQKQHGKIQKIILQLTAKSDLKIQDVSIELINKKREFEILKFQSNSEQSKEVIFIEKNNQHHFNFEHDFFKRFIIEQGKDFRTFRLVVENDKGKKYKTHELAFNKNWALYKPDSGRYN
jgi:predicted CopG family antitoxin